MQEARYIDRIIEILIKIKDDYLPQLQKVADWIFETVKSENCVYFYGCTHAGILTQEAFYRTGGLAIINPIFAPGTLVSDTPISLTSAVERLNGYGSIIAQQYNLQENDLLLIHSVSGRNSVPIDLAIAAKEKGVRVICITGLDYTRKVQSRHPSGKQLCDFCDLVIDNLCPYGDALIHLTKSDINVGPGSTVIGTAILNEIVVLTAKRFEQEGMEPPVFTSANIDNGYEYNKQLYKTYEKNIRYWMQ